MSSLILPAYAQLSDADEAALTELYRRGTPPNTLRAWERDLAYIAAWKMATFGQPLIWPEPETVALRFVLDHAQDLTDRPGSARDVALELIAIGLRMALSCPAPATLDRRIASWQAFHRMRNLTSPFSAPLVQQARQKARRANARPRVPKSPKPVTREVLEALLATCDASLRGCRDRAMLMLAFASGGRRRSEVASLNVEDIGCDDFTAKGLLWIRLPETKTTKKDQAPKLPLKGSFGAGRGALAGGDGAHPRTSVPSRQHVGPAPAPSARLGCAEDDPAAPPAACGLAGGFRNAARPARRVPDPGCAGWRTARRSDEAEPAPVGRAGVEVLCRRRDQREPGGGFAG